MFQLSQQHIILSQQNALVPGAAMLDARTEQDRLWFLSSFAACINFYNIENKQEGNWKPFLMKDPVFLLNSISKTDYNGRYNLFINQCINLRNKLNLPDKVWTGFAESGALAMTDATLFTPDVISLLIRLVDVLESTLADIGEWTYYMQLNDEKYPLKEYVISQVKTEFSALERSLRALRRQLYNMLPQDLAKEIKEEGEFIFFKAPLWEHHKGYAPWWTALDIPVDTDLQLVRPWPVPIFNKLRVAGDEIFGFYHTIITESGPAYEIAARHKSKYPDTTLLRAFVNLLSIQQEQLNTITAKHLAFYFKEILHQIPLPASPDSAYLCATLIGTDAVFKLPAGTLFDAGSDTASNPILFANTNEEILNPALLTGIRTLGFSGSNSPLCLYEKNDVNSLQYDENGLLKSWDTFGGNGKAVSMGFSFGSPILYLTGGSREICIRIKFSAVYDHAILNGAQYFLSTQAGWLPISGDKILKVEFFDFIIPAILNSSYTEACITIKLDPGMPPIEKMDENPDGVNSDWPMFKILFNEIVNQGVSPFIQWINLDVDVKDFTNVQLLSNDGLLSNKTPFTPFGNVPVQNSSLVIGSNEIFSKPFAGLTIRMYWDNLPDNLQVYYQLYNDYAMPSCCPPCAEEKKKKETPAPNSKRNIFSRVWTWIKGVFGFKKKEEEEEEEELNSLPFNNCVFHTTFSFLQKGNWLPLPLNAPSNMESVSGGKSVKSCLPSGCPPDVKYDGQNLFRVLCDSETLFNQSEFYLPPEAKPGFIPDPTLQQVPLEYTDNSQTGFMMMTLSAPSQGFGFAMYPIVISNIALQNACTLSKQTTDQGVFVPPPNPPFVPAANLFTTCYRASAAQDLCVQSGEYPLQCFLYSPFAAFKVYDNTPGNAVSHPEMFITVDGPVLNEKGTAIYPCGIPLYPVFPYNGALLVSFTQLVSNQPLNLFFAFAATTADIDPGKTVAYNYLSTTGWKPLQVLSDSTRNLNCRGIIVFNIPADITNASPLMPGGNYWISMSTNDDLRIFPQVVYLNTNAFLVKRNGDPLLSMQEKPFITAGTIEQAFTIVPELAGVLQPFDSAGGRIQESEMAMNQRVSNRIKTRNRALTMGDFYTLVKEQFSFVYCVKSVRESDGGVAVYVVKNAANFEIADAFSPFISICEADAIKEYLIDKVQGTLAASQPDGLLYIRNPEPVYVLVSIYVILQSGYEEARMRPLINRVISIYLSPWIKTSQPQTQIFSPLREADIANCVNGVKGVKEVTQVSMKKSNLSSTTDSTDGFEAEAGTNAIITDQPQQLFVSVQTHSIHFIPAA
ncbi:MAG: hypothetical protein NTW29_16915 [Bacteroidetes bacterium]|nr:hypothetical protein [Bacteroidota bacterium]